MPKQRWWSLRSLFVTQAVCLVAVFAWSVCHAPAHGGAQADPTEKRGPAAGSPTIEFRTDHPTEGALTLRSLDGPRADPASDPSEKLVLLTNPPRPLPRGTRSFTFNGQTVYYVPLQH